MAVTEQSFTGNGSTTNYSFTFPYLKSTDIQVQVDAVVTTAWSLANATTIQFNTAPANGAAIKILRDTNVDNLTATFYAGSAIKSEDLNDNYTQNLYVTQEIGNRSFENTGTSTMIGNLNMGEDTTIVFEGATDNAYETTLTVTDPTADRTITLPNITGTVLTTADTGTVTSTIIADGTIATGDIANSAVTTAKINNDAITADKIADDVVNSEHYAAASIDTEHIADSQVTTAKIAGDAVTGAKIADDQINSEHYVDGSIDTAHIADDQVTAAKLANTAVTAGTYSATDLTVDAQGRITAAASGTIATSEIAADAITGAKIADDAIDSEHYTDGSIDTAHIANLQVTTAKIAADAIDGTKIADNAIGAEHIAANAVTTSEIADAELTTLAGMQSGTASILADSTALAATTTEINAICDGKSVQTTISDTDASYPTSGAVVDYVTAQIAPLGGLEVIADEDNFPATQPAAGVVISIADAGGVVFNGSGVSTTARTAGATNDNVTINGAPSSLYSETLVAGVGLMVSSTGSSHTYNYHKILGKEDDIKALSDDINDFNERYRVASSAPSSNNDDGDLYFDTTANKMKVYNASSSSWDDVAAPGNFFINTISSSGGSGGGSATFNGTATRFTLSNAPNQGAQQCIVSVNGVIQKPNSGTSPSEGFAIDGNDIIFAAAPAASSPYFIVTIGNSVNIGTPSDNSVSTVKLQNLAVTTAKIAADAIDGTKIADDAINSEHYTDGSIDTAHIADDQVTLAKMAGIARGKIIYGDSSGNPAVLTVGSANQVLQSDGTDIAWQNNSAGAVGGNSNLNRIFWENEQAVTHNYTITNNHNAGSFGPITINSGITVTVGAGESWTVI